ncbi:hypothetical protein [Deinococcus yavapaiensis]|uniref:Uncharacterized protein n=1 Tax=Deinococcus yavapaiensis KR-236 TaxID=694435 RepID=A0A318S9V4_9DEIO|nr:hypothetical protein [Deinococcus yavapaiensis]PYE55018.1 hypothetical protein DES52_104292 [Deinococcus yavapaiensis KR-236]
MLKWINLNRVLPLLLCFLSCAATAVQSPRYVLTVTPGGAEVRVVVGSTLLRFQGATTRTRTVTSLMASGENFVRLGWTSLHAPAEVVIARIDGKNAQVLLRYRVDGVLKPKTGAVNLAVVRDDKPPGGVLLRAFMQKGIARVTINGKPLGDVASIERRDVASYLRRGKNILEIAWSKDFGESLPSGELRLTNGGTTLARWNASDVRTVSGSNRLTFQYDGPDSAHVAPMKRASVKKP